MTRALSSFIGSSGFSSARGGRFSRGMGDGMDIKKEFGGKKFRFTKKNILIGELWYELSCLAQDQVSLRDEIELYVQGYANARVDTKDRHELLAIEVEFSDFKKSSKKKSRDIDKEMSAKQFEMLMEIVELNGYEYDAKFWKRTVNIGELEDLLLEVVDVENKKKVGTSST